MTTYTSTCCLISLTSSLIIPLIAPAHASIIALNHLFSDETTSPDYVGIEPWATITTTDTALNQVTIEFKATNLTDPEYIKEWFINVNPTLDLSLVSFTNATKSSDFVVDAPEISADSYRADTDGLYDVRLIFSESNNSAGIERFTNGDILSYTVTYTGTQGVLDSSSFYFLSQPDAESTFGPFYSAAKVNSTGIDNNGSAWISAAPEPSGFIYSLLATGLFFGFSRKRK